MTVPGLPDNLIKASEGRREKMEQWFAFADGDKGLVQSESCAFGGGSSPLRAVALKDPTLLHGHPLNIFKKN